MLRSVVTWVTVLFIEFVRGRIAWVRRRGSVAQQVFLLQTLIVLTVIVAAVALAYFDARHTQREDARTTSVAVALAVADAPSVLRALDDPDPSVVIQPYAERVRRDTGTDFVVVMGLDRTRYSHPDVTQLSLIHI